MQQDANKHLDQTNTRLKHLEHGRHGSGESIRQTALDQTKNERFHGHHVARFEDDESNLPKRILEIE